MNLDNNIKIRKGDMVVVVTGKERGKTGKVLRTLPEKSQVVVEKLNMAKRHTKPNQGNQAGGIIEKEMPLHISNVMFQDPKTGKPTRLGRKQVESKDGKSWVRYAKKSGEVVK